MKVVTFLTVAGLAGVVAPGSAVNAQSAESTRLASSTSSAVTLAPVLGDREIRRRMDGAERAFERGSDLTAIKLYESLVKDMADAGLLPTEPMWKLATVRYMNGDRLEAASILDALATAAAARSDVVIEVRALLESAEIFEGEGRVAESLSRLDRALGLISSAEIPSETQVALLKRVRR